MATTSSSSTFLALVAAVVVFVVVAASPARLSCEEDARRVINHIYGGSLAMPCNRERARRINNCPHLSLEELQSKFPDVISHEGRRRTTRGGRICATKIVVSGEGHVHARCSGDCVPLKTSCRTTVACYRATLRRTEPELPK